MMSRVLLLTFMLVAPCEASKENPIRKIVKLMQDMSAEIEAEKKKEGELFEKTMCICKEYPPELTTSIAAAESTISTLSSKIEEETALKAKLAEEIKGHGVDKDAATKDLAKATTLREKESAEYDSSVADLKGSIGQLGGAIPALEAGTAASALMQADSTNHLKNVVASSSLITDFDKNRVLAFLSAGDSDSSLEAAAAPGSGEVLGILKQMKDDMEASLKETENAEEVASAGFADLKAAKDEEIELADEAIESKDKKTGDLALSIVQSSSVLEDTQEELADSQKMLKTLLTTCDSKKAEFEARLKLRTDEIMAISEAVTILNDDDALDVFKKAVPASLVETQDQSGFLQTKSENRLKQAVDIVRAASQKASDVHLKMLLQQMSSKMRSGRHSNAQAPDFGAVSKMIDDMVSVLTKEGEEDMKKKDWCVTELHKAEGDLSSKQEAMDTVAATMSQVEDEIAGLAEDVAALKTAITDLDKEVAKASETRKEEHAEYSETLQLTEAAVALIGKAKNRLSKFYNPTVYKAPPKTEASMEEKIIASYGGFVQKHAALHRISGKQMPEIPELPKYEKKNSGGVVALMDKIVLDLEKDKASAEADEKNAQTEYVALMAESQASKEGNTKKLVTTESAKAELESKLVTAKEEKAVSFQELNNAHTFLGDLHASCDFVVQNFDMRAQARGTELESLKSAKAVLAGATFF